VLAGARGESADRLSLVIQYVLNNGAPATLEADVAAALGLAGDALTGTRRTSARPGARHVIHLLTARRDLPIVLLKIDDDGVDAYVTNPAGVLLTAAHRRADGTERELRGVESVVGFDREVAYWENEAETWRLRP
jgi:hypothetical protein